MSLRIQILLIIFTIIFFIYLLHTLRKSKMSNDMALVWIIWAIGLIILALFPQIAYFVASALGIETVINAVYIIMIFILYCLCFYLFMKYSILENKVNSLIQKIAIRESKEKDGE